MKRVSESIVLGRGDERALLRIPDLRVNSTIVNSTDRRTMICVCTRVFHQSPLFHFYVLLYRTVHTLHGMVPRVRNMSDRPSRKNGVSKGGPQDPSSKFCVNQRDTKDNG